MTNSVSEYIKKCEQCIKNDQKSFGGEKFVSTNHPLEITAADLLFIDQKTPVLTFIDYFTRLARVKIIKTKEPNEIKKALQEIFIELGPPEKLVTDNGHEFTAKVIKEFLNDKKCYIIPHLLKNTKETEELKDYTELFGKHIGKVT